MQNIFIAIIIIGVAIMFLEKTGLLSIILKNLKDISNSNAVGEVSKEDEPLPYFKRKYLMSPTENEFYKKLEEVVAGRYYIFPQLNYDKIFTAKGQHSYKNKWHNKIDQKSADYVLFDKTNISPILVIELDDASHEREDRKARDFYVDRVCKQCEVKILHINSILSSTDLEDRIVSKIRE